MIHNHTHSQSDWFSQRKRKILRWEVRIRAKVGERAQKRERGFKIIRKTAYVDTPPHPNKHPSVNHSNPTHLFFCVRHSHTLSHSLHLWLPRQRRASWVHSKTPLILTRQRCEGVSEGKKKMLKTKKKTSFYHSLLSLSLSLSYQLLSHSLSLSLHFLHFSALAHSLNTRRGCQWKKHLHSEKVCQTSHVFMMRHTENAKTHRDGRERERAWEECC